MTNTSATGGFIQPLDTSLVEDDALDAILQGFIVGATGLPTTLVRPIWQFIPPPMPDNLTDWCAFGIHDEEADPLVDAWQHFADVPSVADPPDPTGDGYTISWETIVYTILASFYGPNSRLNGTRLRHWSAVAQNREYFWPHHMQLVENVGALRAMTEVVKQQTYRRQDALFKVRTRVASVWPIENLQQVKATIRTERPDGQGLVTPPSVYPLEPPLGE